MKTKLVRIAIPAVMALSLILALAMPVSAAAAVTPAGGGGAISADDFGTGAWTTLTAIVITEGAVGDIAVGDFVLTIPSGFEFDTTSAPDVAVTGVGTELVATSPAAITATTITVTVTVASATAAGILTIGGTTPIQVRPTQGTPLASGNILMTSGVIAGVDGTTNFGTLTEVHGAATKFVIIDPTDGTVDAPITVTVQLQDQYGNIVTTGGDKDKDVTLTTDGSATGAGLVDIIDGVGTIDISDQVAETVNLGLTDSEGTGFDVSSTQDVVFAEGAIDHYTVTSTSYIQPRGVAFTVTVTAYDQYGNVVTTDSTTQVTMSSSSATMAFDGDGNGTFGEVGDDTKMLTAGTFDIQARDTTVGAGVTITATDPNTKTGTSSPYTIYAPGGGGGGGGGAPPPPPPPPPPSPPPLELEVNLWDDVTSAAIDEDGVLGEDITAISPDGMVRIDIAQGTQVLGPDGGPLAELTVETISEPPDAPEGHHIVSAFDFGPDDSSFDPSLEITIEYDPQALPEGVDEASLLIAYYDEPAAEWAFVPGEVDPATSTVTFSVAHFTAFALLAAAPAPAPAPTPTPTPTPAAGLGLGTWTWAGIGI